MNSFGLTDAEIKVLARAAVIGSAIVEAQVVTASPRLCQLCGKPADGHRNNTWVDRYRLIRVLRGQEAIPTEWLQECDCDDLDDVPF